MSDEENYYLLKPVIRQSKNIIYKGKKYLVDFQLLQQYSNYFYNNREEYAYKSDIEIPDYLLEDNDSSIEVFIKSIQNEKFLIDERNVFSLNLLSSIYEIPSLKEHTNKYITNHCIDLVLSTLLYKKRLNYKNAQENKIDIQNTKEEEEIIATNIEKYINNDELAKLPVSVLYRILNHPKMKTISEDQISRFLFKCLEEHKRTASVLFVNERLNILNEETFLHLLNEYQNIFDFQLIDGQQIVKLAKCLKETKDNLSIQNKQLTEEKDKLNEKNKQINDEKNKLYEQNRQINEEKGKLYEKNKQINEENDNLHKKIFEIQKERDYLKSFVDRIRGIILYKNDDEIINLIEDNFNLSNDVHEILQGCKSKEIVGFIRKDVLFSYNIRKFFNNGDDSYMINQIKSNHDKIQEMIDLENKLKQYENFIKEQEIKEKENDIIINQMKEDNMRLLEEINKLKEKESQDAIDWFDKLTHFEEEKEEKEEEEEKEKEEEDKGDDLNERDIETVMQQSAVSRGRAIRALREACGDLVTAVMNLALG